MINEVSLYSAQQILDDAFWLGTKSVTRETPAMHLRQLDPSHAAAYQSMRLQALWESPTAFNSSYEEVNT